MSIKLLILADDFSGALDVGVKFSSQGIDTQVLPNREGIPLQDASEVLVINTSTRHLPPQQAAEIIHRIVRNAVSEGVPYIFKKTDSVLRGNIGAELSAALDAVNAQFLHFFPAFPEVHRTTKNGIQYYEGVPIHESCLASDPFEPVLCSNVADIIHLQSSVNVRCTPCNAQGIAADDSANAIIVYDSENDEQMEAAVATLAAEDDLHLVAGCAALASVLHKYLPLCKEKNIPPKLKRTLLFACGSVNPISRQQVAYAKEHGFFSLELTSQQQLDPRFLESRDFSDIVDQLWQVAQSERPIVLTSSPVLDVQEGLNDEIGLSQRRERISHNLTAILSALLDRGLDYSIMISGGDVVLEFIRRIGCKQLKPSGELAPGTVLSSFTYNSQEYQLVSKSGGFGERTLLVDITDHTNRRNDVL